MFALIKRECPNEELKEIKNKKRNGAALTPSIVKVSFFIADIINVFSWKNNVQIPAIAVHAMCFRFQTCVYYILNCP